MSDDNVNWPNRIYYHVSNLAYLPLVLKSGEFVPGSTLEFRCEERIHRTLSKRGFSQAEIEELLPIAMKNKEAYMKDRYNYVWFTNSLGYALRRARKTQKQRVFVEGPFSRRMGFSHPVVYIFQNELLDAADFEPEGVVKEESPFFYLRACFVGANIVTKQNVPYRLTRATLVDEVDTDSVNAYLQGVGREMPLMPVRGLIDGSSVHDKHGLTDLIRSQLDPERTSRQIRIPARAG